MAETDRTQTWVEEARQGDAVAVSKLLASFHPMLRSRVAGRMETALKARSEPEDILQQAYLEVFRRIGQFQDRGPDSFRNWLITIVDSKMVDARRALHRKARDIAREMRTGAAPMSQSCFSLLDQLYATPHTPSRVIRNDEAVGALLASMSRLSETHREVIQLRFLDGRPVSEVAEQLERSEAAVVALTKRALEALRTEMDHMGEFTHGW
jgi:RNA polymerase sigma-70 factor (ECF subfamily)